MGSDKTLQRVIFVGILLVCSSLLAFAQDDISSLKWHEWEDGVREAHASGKFLLVDVYTTWCGWCKRMDRSVYIHPRVQELLAAQFVPVKLNAESETIIANGADHYTERECAKLLNVHSYPTTLVFDSNFKIVAKLDGYQDSDKFIRFLHYIGDKQYERYSFSQYLKQIPVEH
jgi:thioredoxin-related protein